MKKIQIRDFILDSLDDKSLHHNMSNSSCSDLCAGPECTACGSNGGGSGNDDSTDVIGKKPGLSLGAKTLDALTKRHKLEHFNNCLRSQQL